jgi:hypothetical protein
MEPLVLAGVVEGLGLCGTLRDHYELHGPAKLSPDAWTAVQLGNMTRVLNIYLVLHYPSSFPASALTEVVPGGFVRQEERRLVVYVSREGEPTRSVSNEEALLGTIGVSSRQRALGGGRGITWCIMQFRIKALLLLLLLLKWKLCV